MANEQIEEILGRQLTGAVSTDENGAYRGFTLHGEPLPVGALAAGARDPRRRGRPR